MIELVEWKQPGFNFDPDQNSLESGLDASEFSLTVQSFGPESDINQMIRTYGLSGELPIRRFPAEYGVFDESMDFRSVLELVRQGESAFASVPAGIRERFGNDAGQFLDWIHDPANEAEAVKLGLLVPPAGVQPGVDVVPSRPSAAVAAAEVAQARENMAATASDG